VAPDADKQDRKRRAETPESFGLTQAAIEVSRADAPVAAKKGRKGRRDGKSGRQKG
jgi:hypothetical protein